MLLKPSLDDDQLALAKSVIAEVIEKDEDDTSSHLQALFTRAGAGIADAAEVISKLMKVGETGVVKLRAAETALKVQGVFSEKESNLADTKIVNITIVSNSNANIVNLLMPRT